MDEPNESRENEESRPLLDHDEAADTKGIYIPVYILLVIFSVSSWIAVNGVWIEMPLFVNSLPEQWKLPSYIVIASQLANIGPVIFSMLGRCVRLRDTIVIYFLLGIAIIATAMTGLFWETTIPIASQQHSVLLIALATILAFVGCSSSVVFLPFAARFHSPAYVAALCLGGWFGAIIPGFLGLAQDFGQDPVCNKTDNVTVAEYPPPNFSVRMFFMVLCAAIAVSAAAFTALQMVPKLSRHMVNEIGMVGDVQNESVPACQDQQCTADSSKEKHRRESTVSLADSLNRSLEVLTDPNKDGEVTIPILPRSHYLIFLLMLFCQNFLYSGFLSSLQSYICLPYGNMTYTLAVRLSSIIGPVACVVAIRWPTESIRKLTAIAVCGLVIAGYMLALAVMSPYPPLRNQLAGKIIVIVIGILFTAICAYMGVVIAMALRMSTGASGLFWFGAMSQIGSFAGAVISFLLVNVLKLFTGQPAC